MNKSTLLKGALAAALVITLPGLSSADNDKCRNVRFRVTNEHSTGKKILITAVKYHDVVNNKQVTKGIANVECKIHETCYTSEKDLKDVEGTNINNIRFVYKYKEQDTDWSDEVTSKAFDPNNASCRADRTYGPEPQGFVITGT
jgi:hypothetical protein